ncbi:hypothetical protein DOTSEDRAFT_72521 [Dothistroma septosporum NZE10]|uniref:Uncharacterized protein n=1 Tax=Dothistroma septosporum (strain NZE10 / CBS 128990) TaxID=675120 RepID=M2YME0_DOTSN|nr:hypothetical protein DOTSEDRAFT_72521 [Dothistroma septosporum NZE10]
MGGQAPHPLMVEGLSDVAPEPTHGLPPYGSGGVQKYGVRDHYSKHPYNLGMLGRACHTPYQQRPGYTAYIRGLIESPVAELLSPVSDYVSLHHGATGTQAYRTITAQPAHQSKSQDELRLKHYREQQQEQAKQDTETGSIRSDATDDQGTTWVRTRQFATSIFSESTSTAASRNSFGRFSIDMGQRGPLVNIEDRSNSDREIASLMEEK